MTPLRKLFVSSVSVLLIALVAVGGASAHRLPKAALDCSPTATSTGIDCTITNFTKHSMTGTLSSPDVAFASLPVTIAGYEQASEGVGFGFVVPSGTVYTIVWQARGVTATTTVQF